MRTLTASEKVLTAHVRLHVQIKKEIDTEIRSVTIAFVIMMEVTVLLSARLNVKVFYIMICVTYSVTFKSVTTIVGIVGNVLTDDSSWIC